MSENNDSSFPFCFDTSNADVNELPSFSYSWSYTTTSDHYTPPSLWTIDSKVENIKVLISNMEKRLSVIEQNILRLVTQIDTILTKVENNDKV